MHDRPVTRPYDALVVSEARTKAIVDSALDCVVTMDAGGRIVEWNPSAERCFGRTSAEVVLLDLQLPDIDGFEVAAQLRDAGVAAAVVLTSSRDWSDVCARQKASGAVGFIPKDELSGTRLRDLVG